jgi:predicted enzyme related to lactoylglutathione lyase
MNTIGHFEIQSSNPERDIEFYKSAFGWTFSRDENILIEYYRIETGGIRGALMKRFAAVPPVECGTNAFTCSIEVDNFDQTSEKILSAGGCVAMPKFAVGEHCWHGYFIDPDNNTFGIFEIVKQ